MPVWTLRRGKRPRPICNPHPASPKGTAGLPVLAALCPDVALDLPKDGTWAVVLGNNLPNHLATELPPLLRTLTVLNTLARVAPGRPCVPISLGAHQRV